MWTPHRMDRQVAHCGRRVVSLAWPDRECAPGNVYLAGVQGTQVQELYDQRYERGYMQDFSDLYEACRVVTVRETLARLPDEPRRVLDYGCGQGRYLDLLRERFPIASLVGSDISRVALDIARRRHPEAEYLLMNDERVSEDDGAFDLILSVEVLEHVADVDIATREFGRLLAPGGILVVTTPCANPGSLEWFLNRRSGGLQTSADGFGRFATDEPGHLRRLTSRDLRVLLARAGVVVDRVDFRAQLFTTLMARLPQRIEPRVRPVAVAVALLDWRLMRRLPNGATMLVVAHRPGGGLSESVC